MQPFPHIYETTVTAAPDGAVMLQSPGVPPLATALPREFGGTGDRWSPETLFAAAVADCFVLTFRGVAAAAKMPWLSMRCDVHATLNRVDRVTRFTHVVISADVRVADESDLERVKHVLERADQTCLVTNSLTAERRFEPHIVVETPLGHREPLHRIA